MLARRQSKDKYRTSYVLSYIISHYPISLFIILYYRMLSYIIIYYDTLSYGIIDYPIVLVKSGVGHVSMILGKL